MWPHGSASIVLSGTRRRNEGAQHTVRELLLEMEKFRYRAGETEQGAVAPVLDLANAFERVSLPVVWAWANAIQFFQEDFAGAMWLLRALEEG